MADCIVLTAEVIMANSELVDHAQVVVATPFVLMETVVVVLMLAVEADRRATGVAP